MLWFEPVLLEYEPDRVVVSGDVNPMAACALVASKPEMQDINWTLAKIALIEG